MRRTICIVGGQFAASLGDAQKEKAKLILAATINSRGVDSSLDEGY